MGIHVKIQSRGSSVDRVGAMGHLHPPDQNCYEIDLMDFFLFLPKSNFNRAL